MFSTRSLCRALGRGLPSRVVASAISYSALSVPNPWHHALRQQVRRATDAISGASVVIADPVNAAAERHRIARQQLTSNVPEHQVQRVVVQLKDLIHTVPYSLHMCLENPEKSDEAQTFAKQVLEECFDIVDKYLNNFNENSEISKVNQLPVGELHTMSEHLSKVMECCLAVYRSSGSCFNPAASPLIRRLRELGMNPATTPADFQIPSEEAEMFGLENSFTIDMKNGTISRLHDRAELDLGGVSKGYTVDLVVEKLVAAGYSDVLFEWGGDCRAAGVNVQLKPWVVGLVRPPTVAEVRETSSQGRTCNPKMVSSADESESLLRVLTLQSEALCTSGDYENVFYAEGLKSAVTSIYDWQSRSLVRPKDEELSQVSVKCDNCLYADALATAALVKRDPVRVRYLLEMYRRNHNRVTDYVAYTRQGERLAHMYEIAKESPEMRAERIAKSLPCRVIVVGGGLAGCAAAIEASRCGAQVVIIEKEKTLGGNSAKATSGINGWGTRAQAKQREQDNCKYFERDTYLSGLGGTCDPGLVRMLSVKSSDAIEWLSSFGIPLTVLSQLGGASRKRCHRAPDTPDGTPVPIGYTIMRTLEQYIRTVLKNKVTILNETAVSSLIYQAKTLPDGNQEKRVRGIRYKTLNNPNEEEMELIADAVVLATGGFSNDQTSNSLLREFAPHVFGTPTTNGPFATGDGLKMARKLGALLVDMDKIQLHPTGLVDPKDPANKTKYLGPEALRGSGGILLNKNGERFINELDLRSVVSQGIIQQDNEYPGSGGCKFAYCVLNEAAVKLFGVNALNYYWKEQGLFVRVEDVEELAKLIGCNSTTLKATLTQYEHTSKENTLCTLTNKSVFPCVIGPKGPFYVAYVTPSIHYTMGGCLISSSAEILSGHRGMNILADNHPILGLFGAGEVTGGVHGKNRLGGNSLLECVVFGKVAGDRAGTILQREKYALSSKQWVPVVVREARSGDQFGVGSRVLRFSLPGALQTTGLKVGQFVGIRGMWDGQQLVGYYSPVTLPDARGFISILARGDKGFLQEWISSMRPGDSVEIKACGGLEIDLDPPKKQIRFGKTVIRKFGLIAGGSGVAPMLQIIRASLNRPFVDAIDSIRLIYAAEDFNELTYREVLTNFSKENPEKFKIDFVLNRPPEGWTGGVGYVDSSTLKSLPPPSSDLMLAICGPPVMQRTVKNCLIGMGYNPKLVRTVDENMEL